MNRDTPEATPPAGPHRPMSATRSKAFEPLLDWMAQRILDMLLEEKRLELEAERTAKADPAAPS